LKRVQVAYTEEGKVLGGTPVQRGARAHCRILPSPEYLLAEFDVPAEHTELALADLWPLVSVDVSTAEHKLTVRGPSHRP
jgi:hypothetical protein